jgi:hypothetical protein
MRLLTLAMASLWGDYRADARGGLCGDALTGTLDLGLQTGDLPSDAGFEVVDALADAGDGLRGDGRADARGGLCGDALTRAFDLGLQTGDLPGDAGFEVVDALADAGDGLRGDYRADARGGLCGDALTGALDLGLQTGDLPGDAGFEVVDALADVGDGLRGDYRADARGGLCGDALTGTLDLGLQTGDLPSDAGFEVVDALADAGDGLRGDGRTDARGGLCGDALTGALDLGLQTGDLPGDAGFEVVDALADAGDGLRGGCLRQPGGFDLSLNACEALIGIDCRGRRRALAGIFEDAFEHLQTFGGGFDGGGVLGDALIGCFDLRCHGFDLAGCGIGQNSRRSQVGLCGCGHGHGCAAGQCGRGDLSVRRRMHLDALFGGRRAVHRQRAFQVGELVTGGSYAQQSALDALVSGIETVFDDTEALTRLGHVVAHVAHIGKRGVEALIGLRDRLLVFADAETGFAEVFDQAVDQLVRMIEALPGARQFSAVSDAGGFQRIEALSGLVQVGDGVGETLGERAGDGFDFVETNVRTAEPLFVLVDAVVGRCKTRVQFIQAMIHRADFLLDEFFRGAAVQGQDRQGVQDQYG